MDISVIVPVYNEDESIGELREWIAKVMQDNNFSYEIIMIDDGSIITHAFGNRQAHFFG